jgi:PPOX class probable F420-dependent enzyme
MSKILPSRLKPLASCLSSQGLRLLRTTRVAHLATSDIAGQPHVIPICFAFDGKEFFSPIDEKPKRAAPRQLKRVKNILENPQVSVVIDHYEEDWRRLGYVLVTGKARILSRGEKHRKAVALLRRKYRQYRSMAIHERPMIAIRPTRIITWDQSSKNLAGHSKDLRGDRRTF